MHAPVESIWYHTNTGCIDKHFIYRAFLYYFGITGYHLNTG